MFYLLSEEAMSLEEIITHSVSAVGGALLGAFAIYWKTYAQKDAEIQVISDNLNEIKEQQVSLAEATEQVKEDIKHQVWKKQEADKLIREKIEEYYIYLDKLPTFMVEYFHCIVGDNIEKPDDIYSKARLIVNLYLPEMKDEHGELSVVMKEFYEFMANICSKRIKGDKCNFSHDLETVGILRQRTMPIIVKIQNTLANKSNAMVSFD